MKKRWFLDMCIIIYYCFRKGHKLEEKTYKFIKSKNRDLFIVCHYILDQNLPKWIIRQDIILKEIKRKLNEKEYILWNSEDSKILFPKDRIIGEKILKRYLISENKILFLRAVEKKWVYVKERIRLFIKNFVDEKVIPIDKIDKELRSSLFTYLEGNMSDANTLASGIQEHNNNHYNNSNNNINNNKNNINKEIIMITADKHHWTENNLEWAVPEGSKLKKQYPKLPEIKYLQDM